MFFNVMKLNIAGAVAHYDRLIKELPVLKLRNKNIQFTVFDGPNLCKWNGGRVNRDITLTPDMVDRYNKFGISVCLIFSNPHINLDDTVGNDLLEMVSHYGKLHNIVNKVVLINDDLRQYIRSRFDLELIYSITGHPSDITINDSLIQRYINLEQKYDVIVPKFELVFQEEFYTRINPEKYELMTNDTCKYGCPHWKEHFEEDARMNIEYDNPWVDAGYDACFKTEECWLEDFTPHTRNTDENVGMDYTTSMVKRAIDIGYSSFKISGRENPVELVVADIKRLLKDIKH